MIKSTNSKTSRTLPSWLVTGVVAALAVLYTLFVFLPGQHKAALLRSRKYELMQYVANQLKTTERIQQAQQRNVQMLQTTAVWHENAPETSELGRHLSAITMHARQ